MFAVAAILLPKAREALRSSRSILDQGSPEFASIASSSDSNDALGRKVPARMLPTSERQKSKTPGFAGEQMNL
jgi:hypothetical protein